MRGSYRLGGISSSKRTTPSGRYYTVCLIAYTVAGLCQSYNFMSSLPFYSAILRRTYIGLRTYACM